MKVSSTNSDDSIQMRDVNSMISDRVGAIVIIQHDGAAMNKAVAVAHSANIPLIAYDRLITDSDLDLYVAFDNVKGGWALARYQFRGVRLAVLILGVITYLVYVITSHTSFGRYLYAIGGNHEAAVLSGIPVDKVIIGGYALLGVIVAITGFMQTAYSGASTTTISNLMELDAIAACVIGGTSLVGGHGDVLGVLTMAPLLNGMTLMAVSPETKFIAPGAVLTRNVYFSRK